MFLSVILSCWVWAAAMNIYKSCSIFKHAPEYIASSKCQVNSTGVIWESQGELHFFFLKHDLCFKWNSSQWVVFSTKQERQQNGRGSWSSVRVLLTSVLQQVISHCQKLGNKPLFFHITQCIFTIVTAVLLRSANSSSQNQHMYVCWFCLVLASQPLPLEMLASSWLVFRFSTNVY